MLRATLFYNGSTPLRGRRGQLLQGEKQAGIRKGASNEKPSSFYQLQEVLE
jgi:hypothetical protein